MTVSEHRSANVSTPHRVVLKRNQSGKEGVAERDILLQSFFSGCSWNQGHWWTVVHFWNSISVSGLNFPSCVCCKCQIISSTTYHKDANLKVLQLKPISPLEQNHGNRGVCGGEEVSFPMWMSVCKRSWAGVKAGTQNGSTRAAKNVSDFWRSALSLSNSCACCRSGPWSVLL